MGLFSKGLKNEFETAVVNEPSVFEPSKFYCTMRKDIKLQVSHPNKLHFIWCFDLSSTSESKQVNFLRGALFVYFILP